MSSTTTETQRQPFLGPGYCHDVEGSFNYYGTTDQPDITELKAVFDGTSSRLRSIRSTLRDLRGEGLHNFNLSTHGFQVLRHSSAILPPQAACIPDFHDEKLMRTRYWPELVKVLLFQLGVRATAAINTTVRDVSVEEQKTLSGDNPRANPNNSFSPFFVVHGDYSPAGGRAQMQALKSTFFDENDSVIGTTETERAEFIILAKQVQQASIEAATAEGSLDQWNWSGKNYEGPRWAILSVWRPFETVHRDPLAIMDPRSLFNLGDNKPYVSFARTYKNRPGFEEEFRNENILPVAPKDGNQYRWHYISEQQSDEVIALKLFDSEAHKEGSRVAPCAAHSAFALPQQEDRPLRRSAEVRVIVIW